MKTINENKEYTFNQSNQELIFEAVQHYLKTTSNCDSMELGMMVILNKILANNTFGIGVDKYRKALENGDIIMCLDTERMYKRSYRRKYKWEPNADYDNWNTVIKSTTKGLPI